MTAAPTDLPMADTASRAAFLYYVAELSQAEIAARLGVSRATVHNMLREARASGLVHVSLDPGLLARARAGRALAVAFGLEAAAILTDEAGAEPFLAAAAGMIASLLPTGARLGVAWGETVYRMARRLPPMRRPDVTVVQLVGSMASPHGFNAEDCSALFAERLGATSIALHAPASLTSAPLAQALRSEPVIARQLAELDRCDVALFAIGLASAESHIVQSGVVDMPVLRDYLARGAAGVVAGRFIDDRGAPMPGPMDGRLIGIAPGALVRVPRRIVVSFGRERARALGAALRGGFATHLVTDTATAEALLALAPEDRAVAG